MHGGLRCLLRPRGGASICASHALCHVSPCSPARPLNFLLQCGGDTTLKNTVVLLVQCGGDTTLKNTVPFRIASFHRPAQLFAFAGPVCTCCHSVAQAQTTKKKPAPVHSLHGSGALASQRRCSGAHHKLSPSGYNGDGRNRVH